MKYSIRRTSAFKTSIKKIKNQSLLDEIKRIIDKLANNEALEQKYHDHKLKGEFSEYRECHIEPDLLLLYQKHDDILVLVCINVGSHSELFQES